MYASSSLFSLSGASNKSKLLILGKPEPLTEELVARASSLNIEHVSPAELMRQEISRHPNKSRIEDFSDETITAHLRRWFWARKPDAGFVLTGFPATLLQAKVFDEWLDARDEALDAVFAPASSTNSVLVEHYHMQGLLMQPLTSNDIP